MVVKSPDLIGITKDIELATASAEKLKSLIDYIAICEFPEILDEESEVEE